MADLTSIRQGLAANLAALDGIQVSPYFLGNPTPPSAQLFPVDCEYDLAMQRGLDKWTFMVEVFVSSTSDIGSQVRLDEFIASSGPQSVKTVLEKDSTLGGAVADVTVVRFDSYGPYARDGGGELLGAKFTVEVLATGA